MIQTASFLFRKINKKHTLGRLTNRFIHYSKETTNTSKILTPGCLQFIEDIYNSNSSSYDEVIKLRKLNNKKKNFTFRHDTADIRESDWKASKLPDDLQNRNVEITGPGNSKKMIINAFNSGADGYMLDLEDSMTPSWYNVINGHHNIKEAVRRKLVDYKYDENNNLIKTYKINGGKLPTFFTRIRGLHMLEENVTVNNKPIPATIFDMATFMYHNAEYLIENYKGPYLYIPKLESYEDAKFINKLLVDIQNKLSIPIGMTKVTCLIETYPAIYQTEEIIYALKDHIVGLNCGRWDYLFSMIKSLPKNHIMPYRDELSMDKQFLENYVHQIVDSCHKRGILAIGGMSAFIPTGNVEENKNILEKIKKDKITEIERGCDGAWVAHPDLVKPIKQLFVDKLDGNNNLIHVQPKVNKKFNDTPKQSEFIILETDLRTNINISLQYISAWLNGNGAVALNGMMEDLATSEISVFQIKQWLNNREEILNDKNNLILDEETFETILEEEYNKFILSNQVPYANRNYELAKKILKEYVLSKDHEFLPDVANKYLNINNGFKGIRWDKDTYDKISGSRGYVSGLELTKIRGDYLNKFLYEDNNAAYKFLGTSNGVSAVNVVAGGRGIVGPYAGGWQHNAMKNRLNMCLPDTLHVSPEESANCAIEINNHLHRADAVQHILKTENPDMKTVNYYDMALLCDLEQGWCTPEKVRIGVLLAIQNGINVIHIEDQGEKKRCGHLGDKELNNYDDYALIMRSANLAAQELLGPEQADKQWVKFVARTDALSAKRIHYSSKLKDPNNPEFKFIDWEKGPTPDGKYLYLKQGINPKTGNPWGLDLSIYRGARIIDEGLASHIWMETPDADLHVAKKYLDGVNEILLPKGKKAQSLYNHSPSFDWDVKFFADAEKLTEKIISWSSKNHVQTEWKELKMNIDLTKDALKLFLQEEGDLLQGDHLFTESELTEMNDLLKNYYILIENLNKSNEEIVNDKNKEVKNKITEIIVERRLKNFGEQLSTLGCNMHLITLPEFHVTSHNMHILSKDFSKDGINAFVKNVQRPERIYSENDHTYTYYKHQTATGTGVEAAFNLAVGSYDVNTLSDSTEQDDLKKRS